MTEDDSTIPPIQKIGWIEAFFVLFYSWTVTYVKLLMGGVFQLGSAWKDPFYCNPDLLVWFQNVCKQKQLIVWNRKQSEVKLKSIKMHHLI